MCQLVKRESRTHVVKPECCFLSQCVSNLKTVSITNDCCRSLTAISTAVLKQNDKHRNHALDLYCKYIDLEMIIV